MPVNIDELYNSYTSTMKTPPPAAKGRENEWTKRSQETVGTMALVAIAEQLKRIADAIENGRMR
jgi:hypothetical protein